jgi:hypothetical protein
MRRTSRFVTCLLGLALVLLLAALAQARPPQAVQGVLELPAKLQRPVALEGQWGFAWERFVDPHWERLPTGGFAPVPSSWNGIAGKPSGQDGWGSYVLQVNCPAGESLAVERRASAPPRACSSTASRWRARAARAVRAGELGGRPRPVPVTREFACPLRLTLHVSNFDHRGRRLRAAAVGGARRRAGPRARGAGSRSTRRCSRPTCSRAPWR